MYRYVKHIDLLLSATNDVDNILCSNPSKVVLLIHRIMGFCMSNQIKGLNERLKGRLTLHWILRAELRYIQQSACYLHGGIPNSRRFFVNAHSDKTAGVTKSRYCKIYFSAGWQKEAFFFSVYVLYGNSPLLYRNYKTAVKYWDWD